MNKVPLSTSSSQPKHTNAFASALTEMGGTSVKPSRTSAMLDDAENMFANTSPSGLSQDQEFARILREKQVIYEQQAKQLHEENQRKSQVIFDQLEIQTAQEVEALRKQLEASVAQSKIKEASIVTTAHEEIVAPGEYHVTFLEQLIVFIKTRPHDSDNWLALFNKRKDHGAFWGKVYSKGQGGGASFMANVDHTAARSAT